jgi:hypothetical protein
MKIRPVRAVLFHADGRTDTTKLVVVFRILLTRLIKMIQPVLSFWTHQINPNFGVLTGTAGAVQVTIL